MNLKEFIINIMSWLSVITFIATLFLFILPQKYIGYIEYRIAKYYPIKGYIYAGNYRKEEWKDFEGKYLRIDQKPFKNAKEISVGTRMIATDIIKVYNDDVFNGSVIAQISQGDCFIVYKKPKSRHGIWNLIVAKTFCFATPRF